MLPLNTEDCWKGLPNQCHRLSRQYIKSSETAVCECKPAVETTQVYSFINVKSSLIIIDDNIIVCFTTCPNASTNCLWFLSSVITIYRNLDYSRQSSSSIEIFTLLHSWWTLHFMLWRSLQWRSWWRSLVISANPYACFCWEPRGIQGDAFTRSSSDLLHP